MSASNNLSTNCSGLLLRSLFAILAARTLHLISVARMAAFSVASRAPNSSDIILRASSEPPQSRPARATAQDPLVARKTPPTQGQGSLRRGPPETEDGGKIPL